jgi:hypothetical protein
MSDIDEVVESVESLERKIERMERTYLDVTNNLIDAIVAQTAAIDGVGHVVGLARSPNEEDLKAYAALREAYDKYEFKRKLILGEK